MVLVHLILHVHLQVFNGVSNIKRLVLINIQIWNDSDDVFKAIKLLLNIKQPHKIFHQDNLFFERVLFLKFLHLSESVTHDCDQHVHEDNANDERCSHEEQPG